MAYFMNDNAIHAKQNKMYVLNLGHTNSDFEPSMECLQMYRDDECLYLLFGHAGEEVLLVLVQRGTSHG